TLTGVGSKGTVAISGAAARTALGLRSTWFRIGTLGRLVSKVKTLEYGAKASLSGVERALPKAVVQTRVPGGAWKALGPDRPTAAGAFAVTVQPLVTTDYRLSAGAAGGVFTRVPVAPRIRFYPVADPAHLRGFVRPLLPGAKVQVQRLDGTTWSSVATAL